MRIKSLAMDYGGDRQAQLHDQAATANLFFGLAADLKSAAVMFKDVAAVVDRTTNAEHTPAKHVADPAEARRQ